MTTAIHEIVHTNAVRRPDAIALVSGDDAISYQLLDAVADDIATALADIGVRPGTVVPVLLPPSPLLVVTLLAVLKCGAAYAALDASWPQARLARVESILAGQLAVTDRVAAPAHFPARIVLGGEVTSGVEIDTSAAARPPVIVDPAGDAAMVFFTSGSTGEPKAVLAPHRATTRLFVAPTFARYAEDTVCTQLSAISWDALVPELWGVLLTGGRCVLVTERPITPAGLREIIARHRVNTVFLTTSLLHLVIEEDATALRGLRTVMTGGERLSVTHAARLLTEVPDIRLVNQYGPVECTAFVLFHQVGLADVDDIPLGRPVPGSEVLILRDGQVCPPGEQGEIHIGGDGLALGYLGDDRLTQEKFVEITVDGAPIRVYRTGDLGSIGPDGLYRFYGRADRQVKVRGFRLEPAGIEHAATRIPGVRRAAVVPIRDAAGNCTALALFFTAEPDGPTSAEIDTALRTTLPAYSVPDQVIALDSFPLSANGKLDTAALLRDIAPTDPLRFDPGSGSILDLVAAEFATVLRRSDVDRDTSFFALGGRSLDAVRLSARLGIRFNTTIPVSRLIAAPTVTGITTWLAGAAPRASGTVQPSGSAELTPMQQAFLLAHLGSTADPENHCALIWSITGPLREDALRAAVQDVHRRHGYLHARYETDDDPLAIEANLPAEFITTAASDNAAATALLDAELNRPSNLAEGSQWRAVLVRVGTTATWSLGIVVHHIAFDGWSQHLLADDLSTAYAARVNGAVPGWPAEVPTPGETAAELRAIAAAADLPAQRTYWSTALTGLPQLILPPVADTDSGDESITLALEAGALGAIDEIARAQGSGRLAVLLAALGETLAEQTGQTDLGIGVPVTRRHSDNLTGQVGCLIDTVCVRLRPAGADHRAGAAAAVASALANADLPFAEVVRLHRAGRSSRHPLYQVLAVVQDAPASALRLADCQVAEGRVGTVALPMAELLVELLAQPDSAATLRVTRDPKRIDADTMRALAIGISSLITRRAAA